MKHVALTINKSVAKAEAPYSPLTKCNTHPFIKKQRIRKPFQNSKRKSKMIYRSNANFKEAKVPHIDSTEKRTYNANIPKRILFWIMNDE